MWSWIITAGGWVLFGLVIFFWLRWTDQERVRFGNGNSHYLE